MENFKPQQVKEMVNDIFNDLDLNRDGLINRREFLVAASQNEILLKILTSAADMEQVSRRGSEVNPTHATAAIAAATLVSKDDFERKASKKKKKKKKNHSIRRKNSVKVLN
jgi:hypothetical protein